jgi:hypothetical protein
MQNILKIAGKVLFFVGLLPLLPSLIFAQWPVSGNSPSAPLQHLHLPGSRFVPSTKRWNLVWADQIVPGNISQAQVKFAAEHYVATQKIWSDQAAQFRAYNPNFLVIIYHLAAGLNPLHNDDCPDPKSNSGSGFIGDITPKRYDSEFADYFIPWIAAKGIPENDPRREAMFEHFDQVDSLHRVWHSDPAWLMNLSNADWQTYCGDVCLDWMKGNSDEGCFFDVAVETNSFLYHPQSADPAPRNFDWWQSPHGPAQDRGSFSSWQNKNYLACYQNIYKRFHTSAEDYLIIPNTDQMVTTVYDPLWTDGDANGETIDGAMMESFGSYRGQDMWLTLERGLRHITGRGKILIAQFYGVDSVERLRRTAMYMLIKNENSFLNIINANGVEWYPEYEIDLGDQSPLPKSLDALRIAGSDWHSVWARDYNKGKVYCNTSDAAITVDIPSVGTWSQVITGGGGKVNADATIQPQYINYLPVSGKLSIPASSAIILRQEMTGIVHSDMPEFSFSLYPNPAHDNVSIRLLGKSKASYNISIVNMLGETVAEIYSGQIESGDHTFVWDRKDIPAGIYFCQIRTAEKTLNSKFILTN